MQGWEFPVEPWCSGPSTAPWALDLPAPPAVSLVKKENAPRCGGDGNNISFVSRSVGLSVFLVLWIEYFCELQKLSSLLPLTQCLVTFVSALRLT